MAHVFRRPDSGIWWYRRRVPEDLLAEYGKREIKFSLRTRDEGEARRISVERDAAFTAEFAHLRGRTVQVPPRIVQAIAGEFYRATYDTYRDYPTPMAGVQLAYRMWLCKDAEGIHPVAPPQVTSPIQSLDALHGDQLRSFLTRRGIAVCGSSWKALLRACNVAVMQALARVMRELDGDYAPDPAAGRFPPFSEADLILLRDRIHNPLVALFDQYAKERLLAPRTIRRYRPIIEMFETWIGPDKISSVQPEHVRAWRDELLKRLSPGTVRDVYLAACGALYNWLHREMDWPTNPFEQVFIKVPKRHKIRQKSFTIDEMRCILGATLKVDVAGKGRLGLALRWAPWICAYTGARISEVMRLRGIDLRWQEEDWILNFESTKEKTPRFVPVHRDLLKQGIVPALGTVRPDFIFIEPPRDNEDEILKANAMSIRIAEWVRDIGVTDPHVQPNHAWRHRMRTILRRVADRESRDAILGHAPDCVGVEYGEYDVATLRRIFDAIPTIPIPNVPTPSLGQLEPSGPRLLPGPAASLVQRLTPA